MPRGADDLVRRWAQGHSVAAKGALQPAARPDHVEVKSLSSTGTGARASQRAIGRDWFWGALAGAVAVALLWAARVRSKPQTLAMPDLPLTILEALAAESSLTGPQAALIVRRLQSMEPTEQRAIRKKLVLVRRSKAGGQGWDVDSTEPEPGALAIARANHMNGNHDTDENRYVTPEVRQFLGHLANGAGARHWDQFVEDRLRESLLVTCPTCQATLPSLWLRPNVGCPSCHHRFPIHESPAVTVCRPPISAARASLEPNA